MQRNIIAAISVTLARYRHGMGKNFFSSQWFCTLDLEVEEQGKNKSYFLVYVIPTAKKDSPITQAQHYLNARCLFCFEQTASLLFCPVLGETFLRVPPGWHKEKPTLVRCCDVITGIFLSLLILQTPGRLSKNMAIFESFLFVLLLSCDIKTFSERTYLIINYLRIPELTDDC